MGNTEGFPKIESKISRRGLIIAGASLVAGFESQDVRRKASDFISDDTAEYVDPKVYTNGYTIMSDSHVLYDFLFSPENKLPIKSDKQELGEGNVLFRGQFTTTGLDTPIDIFFKHQPSDSVQFHPLIVKANGLNIFVPFVTSVQETCISSQLGEFQKPGIHEYEIQQIDGFPKINPDLLNVDFYQPNGSSAQQDMRRISPMYAIRPNNLKGLEEHIVKVPLYRKLQRWFGLTDMKNIGTDAPMIAYNKILVHDFFPRIRKDTVLIFKSEKKGKPAIIRLKEYGRTEDVEWGLKEIIDIKKLKKIKSYDQRSDHRPAVNTSKLWHEHPMQQIKTDNNNFDVEIETDIFFFPVPMYLPGDLHSKELIEVNPALRYLAFMEESGKPASTGLPDGKKLAEKVLAEMLENGTAVYPAIPELTR